MERKHTPPITVLRIPLKPLLAVFFFLVSMLLVVEPQSIFRIFIEPTSSRQDSNHPENQKAPAVSEIIATPEMIKRAEEAIRAQRIKSYETVADSDLSADIYYIIILIDEGVIEASSVIIKPEQITVTTLNGIQSVIPRNTVKQIMRIRPTGNSKP